MENVGKRFGRWTVLRCIDGFAWRCRCDCGVERTLFPGNLVTGRSKSCGCYRSEVSRQTEYGFIVKKHPLYQIWGQMRQRCENPTNHAYGYYGGRGIKVCDRWQTFMNFVEDMFPTWERGLSIDRINVDGNYDPSNCRWATDKQQTENRRTSKIIDTPWGKMTIGAAAKRVGIGYVPMQYRVKRWPQERWFDPPSRK